MHLGKDLLQPPREPVEPLSASGIGSARIAAPHETTGDDKLIGLFKGQVTGEREQGERDEAIAAK